MKSEILKIYNDILDSTTDPVLQFFKLKCEELKLNSIAITSELEQKILEEAKVAFLTVTNESKSVLNLNENENSINKNIHIVNIQAMKKIIERNTKKENNDGNNEIITEPF